MTTEEHLAELRRRLVVSLCFLVVGTIVGWMFVPDILRLFAADAGRAFVFISPAEGFTTYLKLAFSAGMFLTAPVALYQAWQFVLPALFPHERRLARQYVVPSLVLFVVGIGFAYVAVYPLALLFLLGFGSDTVAPVLSIARFVTFFVSVTLPFGLVFQFPIVLLVVVQLGMVTTNRLRGLRKIVWLLAFVVSALLTPPDVASQVLMAIPIIVMYEMTLWRLAKTGYDAVDVADAVDDKGDKGAEGDAGGHD